MPPPLAELESGRSYVAEIFNGTPHPHPMHLHVHTFRVLGSSARTLPPQWADTVLLNAKERIRLAFVAGETGDWMFHCHIVEHQGTEVVGFLPMTFSGPASSRPARSSGRPPPGTQSATRPYGH